MVARAGTARSWRGGVVVFASALLLLAARQANAQCVGDCNGDGTVAINELIIGVNIALGSQPVSACPAFANGQGEVDIAQLIKGVNNALSGCPATPTATATEPATTATATGTTVPSATATATSPAATATRTSSPTATGIPTGTATATATATGIPTGTATATATLPPATATATGIPTGTATATEPPASATPTGIPTGTATATEPPATATATGIPTGTATATAVDTGTPTPDSTAVDTATPTPTATLAPSATPTETAVPPGESLAGRAALISTGLGSIQGLIAAVVTAATNDGSAALVFGGEQGLPPPIESHQCPISGETTRSCTEMGVGAAKTISLSLGANTCVAPGPLGGSGEFDGTIGIDSTAFILNSCSPLRFAAGAYDVNDLTVVLRNATMDIALTISANLDGNLSITGLSGSCLVGALSLTLNGTMSSLLPDGTGIQVQFQNTGVMMSDITYSADCVPLVYTLKFNGNAVFTPLQQALLEVSAPLVSGAPVLDGEFAVSFVNFILTQDATTSPVTVEMDGTMTSDCFGGQLILDTLTPVAVAAGQLCPNTGEIAVNGGTNGTATITYADGGVTVTPEGGQAESYQSCLAPELLMCPA